ncbi:4'-phosphopantetheinyl transferase family protein [Acetivibrio straminisolvens]|jgi:phosphopantetheinyl transferase|uniref:4'-phosphopantetheinyl transferase domain-containing protein n=1 Tax=Acetivibrio straminisolvens JCM 21531 TaxID=1294263 RepID=W4V5R7_9FIRM|nr:4'-phosphopantetheinyl transferase superfamily protein [Acetivibrio straminisolvens]GAE88153.1 hypothetical protein JCM21531_1578 [Acetivibrio straminisolvens JCM 21531]
MIIQNGISEKDTVKLANFYLERQAEEYGFCYHVVDMDKMAQRLKEDEDSVLSVLSDRELGHFGDLRNPKNRLQWISGRYAVKSAIFKHKLKEQSLIDPRCLDVLKGADSAPFILQYPGLCVSITHSFPYCIGMVSKRAVGIDMERVFVPEDSLLKYFFSQREEKYLKSLGNTGEYSVQSTILWTRKEAISKLFRLGMKMDFKELDTLEDEIIYQDKSNVRILSFVCNNYCISLALPDCDEK